MVIRRVTAAFDEPLRNIIQVRNQAWVHLWLSANLASHVHLFARQPRRSSVLPRAYLPSAFVLNPTADCTLRRLFSLSDCSRYIYGIIRGARSLASLATPPMLLGAGPSSSLTAAWMDKLVFILSSE